MPYEWDKSKRRETLELRGIDFASMDYFQWDTAIHRWSERNDEARWSSIGFIAGRPHHVVWTARGDNIRIISLRKANARETGLYVKYQA